MDQQPGEIKKEIKSNPQPDEPMSGAQTETKMDTSNPQLSVEPSQTVVPMDTSELEADSGSQGASQLLRGRGRQRQDRQSPIPRKKEKQQKSRSSSRKRGTDTDDATVPVVVEDTITAAIESAIANLPQGDSASSDNTVIGPGSSPSVSLGEGIGRDDLSVHSASGCESGRSTPKLQLSQNLDRIVSEDSMASDSSYCYTNTKLCSLCNCGEKSLLGQGDLSLYPPTVGFNPFKRQLTKGRGSSDVEEKVTGDKSPKHPTWRRSKGAVSKSGRSRSQRKLNPNANPLDEDGRPLDCTDELSLVGLSDDTEVYHVFEKTGNCWAHHCCAAWSEGVVQADDYSLMNVDKAIFAGLSQKCNYCKNYGATILCRASKCNKMFHYPCASGGGCFQDIKTLSLLCPDHTDQAEAIAGIEAQCVVCETPGDIAQQLFCTSCGQHYHGNCLDPPVEVNPKVRAGWQCPECKICQTCRQPGDDNKMLVCDTCDKGYHTFCLDPVMTTIPKNGWKCKNCRVCGDCGSRTPGVGSSSRWHLNYSVCNNCYQQRNKGQCCPVCSKAHKTLSQKDLLPCSLCKKHVHADCDVVIDNYKPGDDTTAYVCSICRDKPPGIEGELAETLPAIIDNQNLQNIEDFGIFKNFKDSSDQKRQDSEQDETATNPDTLQDSQHTILREESINSMDIDLGTLEKGAHKLGTPSQSPSHSSSSSWTVPKPVGPGKGKPMGYGKGKRIGKKMNRATKGRAAAADKKRPSQGERKRAPKSKFSKGALGGFGVGRESSKKNNDDDDDDHHSTVVIASTNDEFVLKQDMCMSCGSLGRSEEGKLIVCTQCGQCYHPYCVTIKPNKVVLQKGWRCLDCTVCEGCGKPHDEGRLILCDECDISYHIYCLDPPLPTVPKGTWKCKWCAICVTCGVTTPGFGCDWQNLYSQCGPCASQETCPLCQYKYIDEELIIQCGHCERWLHANCDGIKTEEEAESAADYGFQCCYCRPVTGKLGPLPPPPPEPEPMSPSPPPVLPVLPPEPPRPAKQYLLDGVCLSENGMMLIRNLQIKMPQKARQRRNAKKTGDKHPQISRLLSLSERSEDGNDLEESKDGLGIEGAEPLTKAGEGEEGGDMSPEKSLTDPAFFEKKKKPRMRIGMGVGGFIARPRGGRSAFFRRQNVGNVRAGIGSLQLKPSSSMDGDEDKMDIEPPGAGEVKKKQRKQQRPRKQHLEDHYPSALREAFFGVNIIEESKKATKATLETIDMEETKQEQASPVVKSQSTIEPKDPFEFTPTPPTSPTKAPTSITQQLQQQQSQTLNQQVATQQEDSDKEPNLVDEGDLKDLLPDDLMGMLEAEFKDGIPSEPVEPKEDEGTKAEEADLNNIEKMLAPNIDIDKEIADVDRMLTRELAQIDSKTVEDLFKGVLGPGQSPSTATDDNFPMPPTGQSQQAPTMPGQGPPGPIQAQRQMQVPPPPMQTQGPQVLPGMEPQRIPVLPPPTHSGQDTPGSMSPFSLPSPSTNVQQPQFGPGGDFPGGLSFPEGPPQGWPGPPHPVVAPPQSSSEEGDKEPHLSYNKRNIMKWELDEPLEELATISPVLYCNTIHPELKTQYPDWNERAKQISKLWRKVPTEQRAPYLAKARENRANSRLIKAQKLSLDIKKRTKQPKSPKGKAGGARGQPKAPPGQEHDPEWQQIQEDVQRMQEEIERQGFGSMSQPGSEPGTPVEGKSGASTPEGGSTPKSERSPWDPDSLAMPPPGVRQAGRQTPTGPRPKPLSRQGSMEEDIYAHPVGTPHPSVSKDYIPQAQSVGMRSPSSQPSTPTTASTQDPFLRPGPIPARPFDPYAQPVGTPRPGTSVDVFSGPKQMGPPPPHPPTSDPYAQQPGTPMPGPPMPGPPMPGPQDQFVRPRMTRPSQPRPPLPPSASVGYMPGAPRLNSPSPRMALSDNFSAANPAMRPQDLPMGPPGPTSSAAMESYPQPPVGTKSPISQDPYAQPPGTPRPRPADPFAPPSQPGVHQGELHPEIQQMMQRGHPAFMGEPVDPSMQHYLYRGTPRPSGPPSKQWPSVTQHSARDDPNRQDPRRQQLRELLAKRQNKKIQKEDQDRTHREGPLRHWPEEGTGPQSMYPGAPPQGYVERPPPPGYPGVARPPGQGMERWPEQMVRPPHPSQVRPDMDQFGPRGVYGEMGMRQGFPGPMRGMRPGQQGPYPPGQGGMPGPYPPGQFPRHQGQYMDIRQQQMMQERMRLGQSQGMGPRMPPRHQMDFTRGQHPPLPAGEHPLRSTAPGLPMQQHRPGLSRSMSLDGARPPFPVSSTETTNPSPHFPMMAGMAQGPNAPQPRPMGPAGPGIPHGPMPSSTSGGPNMPPTAHGPPGPDHPKTDDGDHLEDLLGADGTFNLLEYTEHLDLDTTLIDEHDKSMFDEHLGIKPEVLKAEGVAPTQQTKGPSATAVGKSEEEEEKKPKITPKTNPPKPTVTATSPKPGGSNTPAPTTGDASPTVKATPEKIKPEKEKKEKKKSSSTSSETKEPKVPPIKLKLSLENKVSVENPGAGLEQIKTPTKETDFQRKFLEFSQRKHIEIPPLDDDGAATGDKAKTAVTVGEVVVKPKKKKKKKSEKSPKSESKSPKSDSKSPKIEGEKIPQMDGAWDDYVLPQYDGMGDETDEEVMGLLPQYDGAGDQTENSGETSQSGGTGQVENVPQGGTESQAPQSSAPQPPPGNTPTVSSPAVQAPPAASPAQAPGPPVPQQTVPVSAPEQAKPQTTVEQQISKPDAVVPPSGPVMTPQSMGQVMTPQSMGLPVSSGMSTMPTQGGPPQMRPRFHGPPSSMAMGPASGHMLSAQPQQAQPGMMQIRHGGPQQMQQSGYPPSHMQYRQQGPPMMNPGQYHMQPGMPPPGYAMHQHLQQQQLQMQQHMQMQRMVGPRPMSPVAAAGPQGQSPQGQGMPPAYPGMTPQVRHSGGSPHPGSSPHPIQSPRPAPSPVGSTGHPAQSPHHPVPSPQPGQSPHPHSRSATPQASPRGGHQSAPNSQPGTPQSSGQKTPTTPTSVVQMLASHAAGQTGTSPSGGPQTPGNSGSPAMTQGSSSPAMSNSNSMPSSADITKPSQTPPQAQNPFHGIGGRMPGPPGQPPPMSSAGMVMPPGMQPRPGMQMGPQFPPHSMPSSTAGTPPSSISTLLAQRSMAPTSQPPGIQPMHLVSQAGPRPGQYGPQGPYPGQYTPGQGMPMMHQGQPLHQGMPQGMPQHMPPMSQPMQGMPPSSQHQPQMIPGQQMPPTSQPPRMRMSQPGQQFQYVPRSMASGGPPQQRLQHPAGVPSTGTPPHSQPQGPPPRYPGPPSVTPPQVTTGNKRPVLLEEQPLLLEDLVNQERIEQQRQHVNMPKPPDGSSGLLTDDDFANLKVDVLGDGGPRPRLPGPPPQMAPGHYPGPRLQSPGDQGPRMSLGPDQQQWMQGPRDPMSPLIGFPPRQPGAQISPRTPSPFQSPGGMFPGPHSPAMQSPTMGPPPPAPPPPPTIPTGQQLSEQEKKQHMQQVMKYEEWLMHQAQWLTIQVKQHEQAHANARKKKKSLGAKQRQAKKNGNELTETDIANMDQATQDQSNTQKQLDQFRKLQRQHQQLVNDYRMKQQERFGQNWPVGPGPPIPGTMPQGMMPHGQPLGPGGVSSSGPMPRMPVGSQMHRMPSQARQEYENYVQGRLRMMGPGGPRPPPSMVTGDENNPFSESYKEREEKLRKQEQQRLQMQQQIEHQRALQRMEQAEHMNVPGGVQFFDEQNQPRMRFPGDIGAPGFPSQMPPGPQGPRFPGPRFMGDGQDPRAQMPHPSPGSEGMQSPGLGGPMPHMMMQPRMPYGPGHPDMQRMPHPGMIPPGEHGNPPQTTGAGTQPKPGDLMQRPPGGSIGEAIVSLPNTTTQTLASQIPADPTEKPKKKRKRKKKTEAENPTQPPPMMLGPHMGPMPPHLPNVDHPLGSMVGDMPPGLNQRGQMTRPPVSQPGPGGIIQQVQEMMNKVAAGPRSGVSELQKLVDRQPQVSSSDLGRGPPLQPPPIQSASAALQQMSSNAGHRPLPPQPPQQQSLPQPSQPPPTSRPSSTEGMSNIDATLHEVATGQAGTPRTPKPSIFLPPQFKVEELDPEDLMADTKLPQNVLLKQLLATPKGRKAIIAAQVHGGQVNLQELRQHAADDTAMSEDGDQIIQLTPEQQRQLAMIESMPLTMETEISQEEWDKKTPEEKDQIIEMRKQEFQLKKKQIEEMTLPKKKRIRKKKLDADGNEIPAKKRPRKGSQNTQTTPTKTPEELGPPVPEFNMTELMALLRTLPPLPLQEPEVHINHNMCPVFGSGFGNEDSPDLKGPYGRMMIEGQIDVYNCLPFALPMYTPPATTPVGSPARAGSPRRPYAGDLMSRRKFLGDHSQPFTAGLSKEQETHQLFAGQHLPAEASEALGLPRIGARKIVLPTPPLIEPRYSMASRASDQSPATIIDGSSPELEVEEKFNKESFKGLRLISMDENKTEEERHRECISPAIPVVCPVPIKAQPIKLHKTEHELCIKKEPEFMEKLWGKENIKEENMELEEDGFEGNLNALTSAYTRPLKDSQNQVSVTLTLSGGAAEDIGGVISAIADLLKIAVPPSYEISRSRSPSPDSFKTTQTNIRHKEEAINIQSLFNSKPKYCRQCDQVVLCQGVRKRMEECEFLKDEITEFSPKELVFCSPYCYTQLKETYEKLEKMEADKITAALLAKEQEKEMLAAGIQGHDSPSISQSSPFTSPSHQPPIPTLAITDGVKKAETKRRRSSSVDSAAKVEIKKWRGTKYKRWQPSMVITERVVKPLTSEELHDLSKSLGTIVVPKPKPHDNRKCVLCHRSGEGKNDGPGRLLNVDVDKWVHLNCALWSHEVYETLNGALMNVDQAIKRGTTSECTLCRKKGATVGCFKPKCMNVYHIRCGVKEKIMFFQDKTMLCPSHIPKIIPDNKLTSLAVFRRVYVNRDEFRQVASIVHQEDGKHTVRVGALIFNHVGQLLPHQLQSGRFHTKEFIYPVGFKTTRYYWSYRRVNKRCCYISQIRDNEMQPEFRVTVREPGFEEVHFKDSSPKGVWMKILEPLEKLRSQNDLVKMFPPFLSGEDLFGLTEPAIVRVIESLPGLELLPNYKFKYGRSPLIELPLAINPTGAARSEPKMRTHFKRPHTLQTSSSSRSLPSTVTVVPGDINAPYMKQFVHSKSQQYRRLKTEWRNNVYLRRSGIQGLGLFAARDLEKHTMVIEYIGELIRSELAEVRERLYDIQNRGVYMFRIDDNSVIDATMSGGPARYVNHSCQPCCVAEVVPFEKDSKIIIIAKRRVARGEELTYDYKFDFEDDQHKIPCNCGAPNCRKWMN